MGNVRKPVIENQVYSEILFLMGHRKIYCNKFKDDFDLSRGGLLEATPKHRKKQSVLYRQLEILREEGYLATEKNELKNKTYYYINWDKIIDTFLDYSIRYLKGLKLEDKKQKDKNLKNIKTIQNDNFRNKCKKNFYIRDLFITSFWDIRSCRKSLHIRIIDVFDYLLHGNLLTVISEGTFYNIQDIPKINVHEIYKKDKDLMFFNNKFSNTMVIKNKTYLDTLFRDNIPDRFSRCATEPKRKKKKIPILTESYS